MEVGESDACAVLAAGCPAEGFVAAAVGDAAELLDVDVDQDEALLSGEEAVTRIKDMTGQQGAQLVLDMVGIDPTLRLAAQVARVLGHLTIVGLGGGVLPVNFESPPHECSVASPYWGSLPELMEMITLAQQQKIKMLVEHFPLERANEAYQLLHDGKIQGRAVITAHP
ncbi:zinc-binding dehydrogenase [Streptomyces sp. ISID311]|uniref:zinc-binding dehydrogenase n=1 Tax=Streptomyces sp. ISID311 TaxID=2601673 RepID=UPI0011BD42A3|nr:zinc-binding dehydrogenase [Streptomyces sp. ISID311]TXC97357.1 zinc-binding dehydrogenase [Streptomyces sp. ISID311]